MEPQIFKYSEAVILPREFCYPICVSLFSLSLLTVTCLPLTMHLIKKHNSPLMRMSFWDVPLSEQSNMSTSKETALTLSAGKRQNCVSLTDQAWGKLCLSKTKALPRQWNFWQPFWASSCVSFGLLYRHYTKAFDRLADDSCHLIYQPL